MIGDNGWTSVLMKWPPLLDWVLVHCDGITPPVRVARWVAESYWEEATDEGHPDRYLAASPTHWMPLPEGPVALQTGLKLEW